MASTINEQQITWSAANSLTVSSATQQVSDAVTLNVEDWDGSVTVNADNAGTPASGDTCDVYVLWSNGDVLGEAFWLGGKRSKIVVTNIHPVGEASIAIPAVFLTVFEKQLIGSLFGSGNPRADIPKLAGLYREGQLDLDGLVTRTYPLEGVNEGYDAMRNGENIRGVLVY